jgi:hypothetical protein
MAVALILDFPGGTKEQYDRVVEKMELHGQLAQGGLFHAAGSYEGGWRVVDAWEDLGTFERFRDEKIGPITAGEGLSPPSVRMIEVAERKPGSGARPRHLQVITLAGVDAETFRSADDRILAEGIPAAMTFHVNGRDGDDWVVVDAWDTREARDEFIESRVMPVMEGVLSGPPRIEDLTVEATLAEPAPAHA